MFRQSWSRESLGYVGLAEAVPDTQVMPRGPAEELTEAQELLLLHLELFVSHVGELFYFSLLRQSPPWSWIRYGEGLPGSRELVLQDMKDFWNVVATLESSRDAATKGYSKRLCFKVFASRAHGQFLSV